MTREPPRPPTVYAIADAGVLGCELLPAAAREMAESGIRWIQIRAKRLADDAFHLLVERCCRELEGLGVDLWIDDRVDLASWSEVAGVHVGQEDLPPSAVRRVVGSAVWIGRSTHDRRQAVEAAADPAVDVVAVGPIFPTTGKEGPNPVVGLRHLAEVRRLTDKPLVAIGGIDAANLRSVIESGADSVAVLGAVCRPPFAESAARLIAAAKGGP